MTDILELCQRIMQRHCQIADAAADLSALVAEQGQEINLLSTLVETPSDKPAPVLCYNWRDVQWPPIPVGSRVRLDHGEFYTNVGVVTEDIGPYCKINVDGKQTEIGKRWIAVLGAPPIAEMAVHAPSEIPPVRYCATDCVLVDNHEGPCIDGGGSDIATPSIGLPVYAAEFAPDCESQTPIDASLLHEGNTSEPQPGINTFGESVDNLDNPLPHIGGRNRTEYTAREWALSKHFLNYMKKHPFKSWPVEQQNTMRDRFADEQPTNLKMNRWGERFSKFCGVV